MPVRPTTKLSRSELTNLNAFLAVERHRSFTQAGIELGISTSALSHAIRNLETQLGVRLLNRTSRTVAPTEAGASLALRLESGFKEIANALDDINLLRDKPIGRLRINALSDGARLVLARCLPLYLQRYPDVELEIAVDDKMVDIVAEGFDAGLRYGDTIPEDLVAVKISPPLKWVAVASPQYLYRKAIPVVPEDLKAQRCIQLRTGQGTVYKWDFVKDGERRVVDVPGQICVNETALAIELALSGVGIAYCLEERVSEHLKSGALRLVLSDWAPYEAPMYLYYPGHRRIPQGLKELIALLREQMEDATS